MAMLDGMQEFAAEMRARPRSRPASTRRAEQIDNLSAPGAQRLSEMIRAFWHPRDSGGRVKGFG
jgi:hypothetical protein